MESKRKHNETQIEMELKKETKWKIKGNGMKNKQNGIKQETKRSIGAKP